MTDGTEDMLDWEIKPGKIMPYDMVVPGAEIYVSPELALKAIDHLARVIEDERADPMVRVHAASAIIAHHSRRRPL